MYRFVAGLVAAVILLALTTQAGAAETCHRIDQVEERTVYACGSEGLRLADGMLRVPPLSSVTLRLSHETVWRTMVFEPACPETARPVRLRIETEDGVLVEVAVGSEDWDGHVVLPRWTRGRWVRISPVTAGGSRSACLPRPRIDLDEARMQNWGASLCGDAGTPDHRSIAECMETRLRDVDAEIEVAYARALEKRRRRDEGSQPPGGGRLELTFREGHEAWRLFVDRDCSAYAQGPLQAGHPVAARQTLAACRLRHSEDRWMDLVRE